MHCRSLLVMSPGLVWLSRNGELLGVWEALAEPATALTSTQHSKDHWTLQGTVRCYTDREERKNGRREGRKGRRQGRRRTENKILKTFLNNQVSSLHLLNTRLRKSYWAENRVRCWARGAGQVTPTTRPHGDYIIVRNLSASEKSNPIKKMVVKLCSTKQTMFRNSVLQKKTS